LPLFLQNIRGLGAFEAGLLMIPQAVGAMVGSFVGGRLYDKIGARWPTVIGLLITGYITLQLASIDVTTSDSTLRLLLGLRGIGMGFALMPVMTFSLQEVPMELTAQASAISNVFRPVFAGLGIAVFASLLDSFQKSNLATMVQTATPDSGITLKMLSAFQVGLQQAGMTLEGARQTAIWYLYQLTFLRAYVASFDKVFFISAIVIFIGVIPALFLYNHARQKKTGRIPVEQ
jgi:MFS family permease